MNNKYRNILLACMAFAGMSAMAEGENLSKEIVIEKDYVPTEQKAARLNEMGEVKKVTPEATKLNFSDWAAPANVNSTFSVLLPYGYNTSANYSKQRGYFDFGIGSFFNMVSSAGYKILDTESNKLNIWFQHNSTWGGENRLNSEKNVKQKFLNDILGANFAHRFGENVLSASGFYRFNRFNFYSDSKDLFQNVNEINLSVALARQAHDEFKYNVGLSYNHFANKDNVDNLGPGMKENIFTLTGGASTQSGEFSRVGIDFKGDYVYYTGIKNNNAEIISIIKAAPIENSSSSKNSLSYGVGHFNPYFDYSNGKTSIRFGANLDVSFNDGVVLRISPDVKFAYKFIDGIAFYTDFAGGKYLNTMSKMATINRYFCSDTWLANSYSPVDAVVGLKFGPFSGFTAKAWGGYAIVNSQLLPNIMTSVQTTYGAVDIKGWQFGAELGYRYKEIAELKVKGEYSKQERDKGYVFSQDRPEYVVNVNLGVNPIQKLRINLDYELRGDRNAWTMIYTGPLPVLAPTSLGDFSNLSLGARYEIMPMLSVFAQARNILNKSWQEWPGYSNQKFNALAGVAIIF